MILANTSTALFDWNGECIVIGALPKVLLYKKLSQYDIVFVGGKLSVSVETGLLHFYPFCGKNHQKKKIKAHFDH